MRNPQPETETSRAETVTAALLCNQHESPGPLH